MPSSGFQSGSFGRTWKRSSLMDKGKLQLESLFFFEGCCLSQIKKLFLLPEVAVLLSFEVVFIVNCCLCCCLLHFSLFLSSSTLLFRQSRQIDWHHEDTSGFFVSDADCGSIRPDQHHRVQSLILLSAAANHWRPVGVQLRSLSVDEHRLVTYPGEHTAW